MATAQTTFFSQFSDFNPASQGGSANPYFASPHVPPPRKSKAWLWILLGVFGGGLALCGGCCGFAYLGMQGAFTQMENEIKAKLNADPVAQQHLGTVTSVKSDFWASTQETQKRDGLKTFIFHAQGTKASGDVIGRLTSGPDGEGIVDPKLVLPSGEEFDLSF